MQPLYEPAVGDIVMVERDDHWGDRVPRPYRHYVTLRTYLYKAKVVRVCPDRPYHRVVPLPWQPWDMETRMRHSRKAYRVNIFSL